MRVARFALIGSLVAVLYFGGVVRARGPVPQPVAEKAETGTIEGRVQKKDTCLGEIRVTAILRATGQSFFTQSDADGSFRFSEIPPGEYAIFARGNFLYIPGMVRGVVEAGTCWRPDLVLGSRVFDRDISGLRRWSISIEDFRGSDAVVFGTVLSVKMGASDDRNNWLVQIQIAVSETLKGKPGPVVTAEFEKFGSTLPDSLAPGKTTLAFLSKREKSEAFSLDKTFSPDEIQNNSNPEYVYLRRIIEVVRKSPQSRGDLVESLINGLSDPQLRQKSLEELSALVYRIELVSGGKDVIHPEDVFDLAVGGLNIFSESQKNRIAEGLEGIETVKDEHALFLRLLVAIGHHRIGPFLWNRLNRQKGIPQENTGLFLSLIADLRKDKDLDELSRLYGWLESSPQVVSKSKSRAEDKSTETPSDEVLRTIIKAFVWTREHSIVEAK